MSDSGPEMLMDNLSIISNPRPGLQPYFTTSREILPTIADDHVILLFDLLLENSFRGFFAFTSIEALY